MKPDLGGSLERILSGLVAAHEELLDMAREQRAAMSRADGARVEACSKRQGELVQRIAGLEEERRKLMATIGGAAAASMSQVASGLPEPVRARIMGIVQRLREVLLQLQEQNRVLRIAAAALVANMDGLMHQVSRRMSDGGGAGMYGRQGKAMSGPAACALDMRY